MRDPVCHLAVEGLLNFLHNALSSGRFDMLTNPVDGSRESCRQRANFDCIPSAWFTTTLAFLYTHLGKWKGQPDRFVLCLVLLLDGSTYWWQLCNIPLRTLAASISGIECVIWFASVIPTWTHRPVRPLLAAVFAGPAPQLRVAGRLDVHRVDDVEELLHDGHALVHEVHLAVHSLKEREKEEMKHVE